MKVMKRITGKLSVILGGLLALNAHAFDKEISGTYVPVKGFANTYEIANVLQGEIPQQLGNFKLVLKRKDWALLSDEEKQVIKKRVVIKGVVKGVFDPNTGTSSHVLVAKDRSGVLYTELDFLIPNHGDIYCSSGQPMSGLEQMNFVRGTGIYSELQGGTLLLDGVINNCSQASEFLQNDFTVKGEQGEFVFGSSEVE